MHDEPREDKRARLRQFAGRVDSYVVQQWVRQRRDSLATARALGLEPATIGVVVDGHMSYDDRGER